MATQELKKSLEKIGLIFSNMKDPILVISQKNKILFANENALKEFGKNLVGKNCYETLFKRSKPCESCPIEKSLTIEQRRMRFEKISTLPSTKETKYFGIDAFFVEDFYGNPAVIEVFRDITESKKIEAELHRYQMLINNSNAIVLAHDDEWRVTLMNPYTCKVLGYEEGEMIGKDIRSMLEKNELERAEPVRQKVRIDPNMSQEGFEQYFWKKGKKERVLISWNVTAVKDTDGKAIGIQGVGQDITERKKAEEELGKYREHLEELVEERTKKLQESEEWLSTTLNSIGDAVIATDTKGKISFLNPVAESLTGWKQEEATGKPVGDIFNIVNEKTRKQIESPVSRVIREDVVVGLANHTVLISKEGKEIPIADSGAPIKDDKGNIIGVVLIFRDITERIIAENAMKDTLNALKRSNEELQQFAYVASHDLQQPLRMVTSYTQLLAKRYKDKLDEDANEFIKFAVDGANNMKILIEDLLEYSRIQTRGNPFEVINCEEVLKDVLFNLHETIKENDVEITHDYLPNILADKTQLIQVFQNLIDNALKFRSKDPVRIHISAKKNNNNWQFSVKDNGIGIDPEYFDRIFIIFQCLHRKSEYPGTGIGLALCKKIIERHNGKIWVESEVGKGSTFHFTIPIKKKIII